MSSRKATNRATMPQAAAIFDALRNAGMTPAWCQFRENDSTLLWGLRVPDRRVPPVPGLPAARRPQAVQASQSSYRIPAK